MSDSEEFDEMMDIEFPMDDSEQDEEAEQTTSTMEEQKESSPLIDITVKGWDDNIVSKCFLVATVDYSAAQDEFQSIVKPDKRLNVNSRKVELLNGGDDDQIGNNEQQSSKSDDHRNTSETQEYGVVGTFDQKATLPTPNWAI